MNDKVKAFFERYDSDSELRARVGEAEALYPGSLEIREAVVSAVLLPIAGELGLDFTVEELSDYEEELWEYRHSDERADAEGEDDGEDRYWLMGRGWSNDEARFCGGK